MIGSGSVRYAFMLRYYRRGIRCSCKTLVYICINYICPTPSWVNPKTAECTPSHHVGEGSFVSVIRSWSTAITSNMCTVSMGVAVVLSCSALTLCSPFSHIMTSSTSSSAPTSISSSVPVILVHVIMHNLHVLHHSL